MNEQKMISGPVVYDGDSTVVQELQQQVETLRRERRQLEGQVAAAQRETEFVRRASGDALVALRRQLTPLYRALQGVFGELDAVPMGNENEPMPADTNATTVNPRHKAAWESWKARLGGGCAKVIDALMVHGEANTQQLAIAVGMHRTSIPKLIYTLNKAGLLSKNGGRFSLKPLP